MSSPRRALRFPDLSVLTVALTSGLVPAEVAARPARVWREADGTVYVVPAVPLEPEVGRVLAAAGVPAVKAESGGVGVVCWAEILPPRATGVPGDLPEVLFVVPDETSLLELAGELLRLGCDRQQLGAAGERFLLRAIAPPYYTVARALDRVGGLRAFVGRERVLTEIGWTHPLAALLRMSEDRLLLIEGDGRFTVFPAVGEWRDVYQRIELELPGGVAPLAARALSAKLRVPLRLARAGRPLPPSLWVLREDAEAQLDALVHTLPDEVIGRLLFAFAEALGGGAVAVVKARPGASGPPDLALRVAGHVPLLQIANLFVPADSILEPPLRRDVVQELLAPDPDVLAWLEPGDHGEPTLHSLPESALTPLEDWILYVVERGAEALEPWVQGATFAFEDFESTGAEWGEGTDARARSPQRGEPRAPAEPAARPTRRKPRAQPAALASPAPPPPTSAVEEAAPEPGAPLVAARAEPGTRAEEVAALERRFLDLEAPADAPARTALWLELACLYTEVGRSRDAGLCWTRAVWEAPAADADALLGRWAEAEAGAAGLDLTALLSVSAPDRDRIRAVAARVSTGGDAVRAQGRQVATFLDRCEDDLDPRSSWLARSALSRAVGGDLLGLTRAHDRVLARLHRGLSIDRDVPSFLRFVGRGQRGESTATELLVRELAGLQERFAATTRARSSVEAPLPLTRAYVELTFAYGLARLGQTEQARRLAGAATGALDLGDPVHRFLVGAYRARVTQALDGHPPETALPADLTGELNRLERFLRYKVDRLRQLSAVLEPQERLDPMVAFHRNEADPRGGELGALRGEADGARLAAAVAALFQQARAAPADERARLFDGLMDFFPQLPESQAVPYLDEIGATLEGIAPPRQAQLLEEALVLAAHFGRPDLVQRVLARLVPVLADLGPEHVSDAASMVATSHRALRRVGLEAEAVGLIDTLRRVASGEGTPMVVARLHLAAASFALNQPERAQRDLDEALAKLDGDLAMADRLQLVRGAARAATRAPQRVACSTLARLAGGLPRISDSFNTNSHFCLSVIAFMESLILGYAAEDLALGDLGRQWLDDDEYLVRRRVHRDLANPS